MPRDPIPTRSRPRPAGPWHAALLLVVVATAACSNDDREARRRLAGPRPTPERLLAVASPAAGAGVFTRCAACHTIAKGSPNRAGPNLYAIMGKPIAEGSPTFGYTDALQSVRGRWDARTMDRWLTDPAAFAPGTSMTFAGLRDPLDRADVIAYLRTRSDAAPAR